MRFLLFMAERPTHHPNLAAVDPTLLRPDELDTLNPRAPKHRDDDELTALMDAVMSEKQPPSVESTSQSLESPLAQLLNHLSWRGRRVTAVGTAAVAFLATTAAGVGVASRIRDPDPPNPACADATHLQTGGGDLPAIAGTMANDRGYYTDAALVLAYNPTVRNIATGERVELGDNPETAAETLDAGTQYCFIVPPPIVSGQQEADGVISLAHIADAIGQSPDNLHALNKDRVPTSDDDPIPAGTIIWLGKEVNPRMVLRTYHGEKLSDLAGDDPNIIEALADANIFAFSEQDALGLQPDSDYFLPYLTTPITPAMRALGLTPADILRAYQAQLTYDTRNQPIPEPQPSSTTTPEVTRANHLTAEQEAFIEELNLSEEHKQFFLSSVDIIMQLQHYADQHGINMTVMFAQAILESDYGQSEKARLFHNYFGMKTRTGDGWTGQDTGSRYPEGKYRIYDNALDGYRGYIDNISSPHKPWYHDARAHANDFRAYLAGLLNTGDGEFAYAEDPQYAAKILRIISQYHLEDLLQLGSLVTSPTPEQQPPTPEAPPRGPIVLNPANYRNNPTQSALPANGNRSGTRPDGSRYPYDPANHQGPWLMYNGKPVLSSQLTYRQRLELVQNALNGAHVSAAGFAAFNIVDVSAQVMADPRLTNFHGISESPATPNVHQTVKYFVWHFTANNTSANDYEGYKAAGSMQNGGRHVGIQYYQDGSGRVYHLTNKLTYHTLNHNGIFYNGHAFGMEIAACEQGAITSKQYESGVYLSAQFLIDNGFVAKGQPVTPIVRKMIIGHHEANPNGHDDNPSIVMDQVRPMIVNLLVQLGYTA